MNIVICDDKPDEAQQLAGLLRDLHYCVNTKTFFNGNNVLEYIHSGAAVDVQM